MKQPFGGAAVRLVSNVASEADFKTKPSAVVSYCRKVLERTKGEEAILGS